MNSLADLVVFLLPVIVVGGLAYMLVSRFLNNEREIRNKEKMLNDQKVILPVRLQAYERLMLFMERISPESLIVRTNKSKISAKQYQSILLNAIRGEFEHNLSQQLYISNDAWEMVKNARSNVIKLINTAADELDKDATANDLAKLILEMQVELDSKPTELAIKFLKSEVKKLF